MKDVHSGTKARQQMKLGLDTLADAVKLTLGPRGRNVLLEKHFGAPKVTKDGVTVAKEIDLGNKLENLGSQLVKEVASRTNDDTGDGTTTATVLAQALFDEGLRLVEAGVNPMGLKRGVEAGTEAIVKALEAQALEVKGNADLKRIATLSANGDETLGGFIAQAFDKVGAHGVITVEEGQGLTTEINVVEGMRWDRGYISPYFITNQEKLTTELTDVYVLVHEPKLSKIEGLIPILEAVKKAGGSLLVVAEDVSADALAALTLNKLRGVLKCAAVKSPGFGERRKAMIQDIAVLTGGYAFTEATGMKLEALTLKDLGRCSRVLLDKENCTLVGGKGSKEAIQGRIAEIEHEVEATNSTYDKSKLQERLARIAGGVAVIRAGAATQPEAREIRDRIDDSVAATRAALQEGYVAGGGAALLKAATKATRLRSLTDDEKAGARLVALACEAPLRQIAHNAGAKAELVVGKVRELQAEKGDTWGYDARRDKYCDLVRAGIIDPLKVVRASLQNAASVVALLLTTEAAVTRHPKPKAKSTASPRSPAGQMPDDDFDMH